MQDEFDEWLRSAPHIPPEQRDNLALARLELDRRLLAFGLSLQELGAILSNAEIVIAFDQKAEVVRFDTSYRTPVKQLKARLASVQPPA